MSKCDFHKKQFEQELFTEYKRHQIKSKVELKYLTHTIKNQYIMKHFIGSKADNIHTIIMSSP